MAFDARNFQPFPFVTGESFPRWWAYMTADDVDVVTAAGYFNGAPTEKLSINDLIWVSDTDALQVYSVIVTATGPVTVQVSVEPPAGLSLSPLAFGAKGDGVTNDYTALMACFAAAASLGVFVDGGGRVYKCNGSIALGATTRDRWRNITLDCSTLVDPIITESGVVLCVQKTCTAPVLISALSGNAAQKATTISLTTVSGLSEGDYIFIVSDQSITSVTNTALAAFQRSAELNRVLDITGTTVTLYTPTQDAYATADAARVYRLQTAAGVYWDTVKIIGEGLTRVNRGFSTSNGFESIYDNCSMDACRRAGIVELEAVRTRVLRDWSFENVSFAEEGYGVSTGGCHECEYGFITGKNLRHAFNTNGSNSLYLQICQRDCNIKGVRSYDALGSPVDTHPGVGMHQVGDVWAHFRDDADTSSGLIFCQGGGVQANSAIGLNCSLNGAIFQCYGWRQENFEPIMQVGRIYMDGKGSVSDPGNGRGMVTAENRTSEASAATTQRIAVVVGSVAGIADMGIRALSTGGETVIDVGPGTMVVRNQYGVRALAGPDVGTAYTARVRMYGTELVFLDPTSTPVVADSEDFTTNNPGVRGAFIEWRGGRLSCDTKYIASLDGFIYLDGVQEPAGSVAGQELDGIGQIVRRPMTEFLTAGNQKGIVIASGAITIAGSWVRVDTEGGAATDDLDTITPPDNIPDGSLLFIRTVSSTRDVTLTDGVGNIRTPSGGVVLSHPNDVATLIWDADAGGVWQVVAFSDNA